MENEFSRRRFLRNAGMGAAAIAAASISGPHVYAARNYSVSLGAWSLNRTIRSGKMTVLDLPKVAREDFGLDAVELVNVMLPIWMESFADMKPYLDELQQNAKHHDVKILLIQIEREHDVGSRSDSRRARSIADHKKWIDAADYLGCHSVRLNWRGESRVWDAEEGALLEPWKTTPAKLETYINRSLPGIRSLCDYGAERNIDVLMENHGGPSFYPAIVEKLMAAVDHPRFGTMIDFGNFPNDVDRYEAIDRLMKFAKQSVNAKCYAFDDDTGEETKLDYARIIEIVADKHGYDGYIGIEYEGESPDEMEGVRRCKALLEKLKVHV